MNCSFCGKPPTEVFRIIASPSCAICNECVGRSANMIAEEFRVVAERLIKLPKAGGEA
jgi:ATP-dependent protease Clp ATPase subunit